MAQVRQELTDIHAALAGTHSAPSAAAGGAERTSVSLGPGGIAVVQVHRQIATLQLGACNLPCPSLLSAAHGSHGCVMAEREMLKQQQDAASLARLEAVRLELAALKSQLEAAVGVQEGVPPPQ